MTTYSQTRRDFLEFITNKSLALIASQALPMSLLTSCASKNPQIKVEGIKPDFNDNLSLAQGLNYHIISQWGDPINKAGEEFGFNNDFTCFLPNDDNESEGILWVNHEAVYPQFLHDKPYRELIRSKAEFTAEQKMVGGSILHIKKQNDRWQLLKDSQYNKKIHGGTSIPFSHNYKIRGSRNAIGTIANCAGGLTPWKTFLTSEENYDDFYGEATIENGTRKVHYKNKYNWYKHFPHPPEHYGWIVEVNPYTGQAIKQVLLGRAPHEGATPTLTKNNKVVVYMAEDRPNGYIFKFVSTGKHLKKGTLYAADTKNGRWLALDRDKNNQLQKFFSSQLDVLTYAHQSAAIVGATPQDRPEDIQINKQTGDILVALTKNPSVGNLYGSLLKISENNDFDSLDFQSSTWLSGGLETGLACPDNLCFDKNNNLWVSVDMSEKEVGHPNYKMFGNNGLYYIPLHGSQAGKAIQIASAPKDAELTGPWFSPDHKTLFLSVQHPGAMSRKNYGKSFTSHWPSGNGKMPRSAVVAIQGSLLDRMFA